MDIDALIAAYEQWVSSTPSIYTASFGSPQQTVIVPTLESFPAVLGDVFTAETVSTDRKIANTVTLDGFAAWYKYIYLPAQV